MDVEQLTAQVMGMSGELSALREGVANANRRIDENKGIIAGIHTLAVNVEALALQVKHLTERMEASTKNTENALRMQSDRIDQLEKKPAKRWDAMITQIITLLIAAVAGGFLSHFFN